jgi:hypothetical protein
MKTTPISKPPQAASLVLAQIIQLHGEIADAARVSLEKAMRIGELLEEEKTRLGHGAWLPWVQKHLPFTERTARNYMRIYENRERLKSETVSDLTQAYRLLAEPAESEAMEVDERNPPSETLEEFASRHQGVAAATANEMSPIGDIKTESQARELSRVPKEKRSTVLTRASAKARSQGRDMNANDIKQAAGRTIEPESDIKRQFPGAAKSQRKAEAWWYHSAKPGRRGTFISTLVGMNRPVQVNDKEDFKRRVLQWLDTYVKEAAQ